jgi:hypothetical protein
VGVQHDRRAAPLRFEDAVAHDHDAARIGPRGRLVQKEQLRIPERRLSDADPLEHPPRVAGELSQEDAAFQSHARGGRGGLPPGLAGVSSGEPPVLREKGAAGQVAVEAEALRHIARSCADGEVVRRQPTD